MDRKSGVVCINLPLCEAYMHQTVTEGILTI